MTTQLVAPTDEGPQADMGEGTRDVGEDLDDGHGRP